MPRWILQDIGVALDAEIPAWNAFRKAHPYYKPDLRYIPLEGSDLSRANLSHANLDFADLSRCRFDEADLTEATFCHSTLVHARLKNAVGLWEIHLGGANLAHAQLPRRMDFQQSLERVEAVSKNSKHLFSIFMIASIFCFLIIRFSDAQMILNAGAPKLPFVGAEVPVNRFFLFGPPLLLFIFLFLQFYMRDLWRSMSFLPAIFPDGKALDQRAFPWLFNSLVRYHSPFLKIKESFIFQARVWLCVLLGWFWGPLIFLYFWWSYLRNHDPSRTLAHILFFITSCCFAIFCYRNFFEVLHGRQGKRHFNFAALSSYPWHITGCLLSILIIGFSFYVFNGDRLPLDRLYLDVSGSSLSQKPDGWEDEHKKALSDEDPQRMEALLGKVLGANLQDRNFNHATLTNNFLVNADLQNSRFLGAYLDGSDLRKANLKGAFLCDAFLKGVNLDHAVLTNVRAERSDFRDASIYHADLSNCRLQYSNFEKVKFRQTYLIGAQFQYSNLNGAIVENGFLNGADFSHARMNRFQILETSNESKTKNLNKVNFRYAVLTEAKLNLSMADSDFYGADLTDANLAGAVLINADMRKAILKGCNLTDTDLSGSQLEGADLQFAHLEGTILVNGSGLTFDQLKKARVYPSTVLPDYLEPRKAELINGFLP